MNPTLPLTEAAMQELEARIPELAGHAVKRAYQQALVTSGKVLEARHGELIETTAQGQQRLIRQLTPPTAIAIGTKRIRARI
ncbi:MAG: hypothetical protein RLZZ612_323 [Pseudomonadota bacterium]|jgi:hypothetical protein